MTPTQPNGGGIASNDGTTYVTSTSNDGTTTTVTLLGVPSSPPISM